MLSGSLEELQLNSLGLLQVKVYMWAANDIQLFVWLKLVVPTTSTDMSAGMFKYLHRLCEGDHESKQINTHELFRKQNENHLYSTSLNTKLITLKDNKNQPTNKKIFKPLNQQFNVAFKTLDYSQQESCSTGKIK